MPVGLNVPPVSVASSAPYFFIAVGLCIANDWITSDEKNTPDTRDSWTTILYLPTALQLLKSGAERFATSLFLKPP